MCVTILHAGRPSSLRASTSALPGPPDVFSTRTMVLRSRPQRGPFKETTASTPPQQQRKRQWGTGAAGQLGTLN